MRYLVLIATLGIIAGCASKPTAPAAGAAEGTTAAATDTAKPAAKPAKPAFIPERIKGPYKVVMKGDQKLYCTKELATGSKVNFRTICMTPEEYAAIEQNAREWRDIMGSAPNYPSAPRGLGPGQNPLTPPPLGQ
jgi:hypothetical protein